MKLSVIIVNYNVKYFLEQCLISVFKALSEIDSEVFVVDNHSVDGSLDMVRDQFPDVICIDNQVNLGFSKANNQAIKLAKGEYVLLLNPDTVVEEDTFSKCLSYMDMNHEAGALGVKMIDGNGRFLPESKRGLPTPEVALYKMIGLNKLFPRSRRFGKYHMGYVDENEVAEVDVLAGAFMLIRRAVLVKTGPLDETFFMYGEDIDLSFRITREGYKNIYFPKTSIIHYKGESTRKMSVNYVFVFYRAMVIFAKKHYKGQNAKLLIFFINLAIWGRAFLSLALRFISKVWIFVADAALLLIGLFLIKDYWEEHIKLFDTFPRELVILHFPYYTFLWVSSVYLSGGYQKPWSAKRLIRGIIIGTVVIAAVYGLLPNHLRYSRGIILVGSLWAGVSMLGLRILVHFRKYRNFDLGGRMAYNTVIVGALQERQRVLALLQKSLVPPNFLGFISTSDDDAGGEDVLGSLDRLDDLCEIYKVNEVIFCAGDVSSSETMKWMKLIGIRKVHFKIVPEERYFIIGSNSKDLQGELYTEEIEFDLNEDYNRKKKRLLDIVISLLLLPFGLILGWFGEGVVVYYQRVLRIFWNRQTWVGYNQSVPIEHLPALKEGVFSVSDENPWVSMDTKMNEKLNYLYAKNYHFDTDINIVIRNMFTKRKEK